MSDDFKQHLLAKKLSEKTIDQYLKHMRLFEKECNNINQASINRFVSNHQGFVTRAFLKNLFQFFNERGFENLPIIPKIKGRDKRLSKVIVRDKDLKKIRRWLLENKNYKYVLMFDLSYLCGLRREEVVSIKKESFYWDTWEDGKGLRLKVYAKGKERIVVVPSNLAKKIIKHFIKVGDSIGDKPFFRINVSRWHQVFKSAVKKTCKENITLHDLRRKRATTWLDQGIDLDEVRRRLGHSSISTTQKYLIRSEEERLKKWEDTE